MRQRILKIFEFLDGSKLATTSQKFYVLYQPKGAKNEVKTITNANGFNLIKAERCHKKFIMLSGRILS